MLIIMVGLPALYATMLKKQNSSSELVSSSAPEESVETPY